METNFLSANIKFFDYVFPVLASLCFCAVFLISYRTIKNILLYKKDKILVKLEPNFLGKIAATLGSASLMVPVLILNDYSIIMVSILCIVTLLTVLNIVFCFSKNGVSDSGVYVSYGFIKFSELTDYYIDNIKNNVTFSCHRKGGLTLKGTTRAVYFSEEDEEKIIQILKEKHIVGENIIIR